MNIERLMIPSKFLQREVVVDIYNGVERGAGSLLLVNDGQDLERMGMGEILGGLAARGEIGALCCVGIHAGPERTMEYGTAAMPDHKGWGAKAGLYTEFVLEELMPEIDARLLGRNGGMGVERWTDKGFAGFSLGALSAMDMVWAYPDVFSTAGLFSGSFWWRMKDKDDPDFDEQRDRIMHALVARGGYHPGLRFFFECGTEDELEDRNGNGVIDSIDDVRDLMGRLAEKGYESGKDIRYFEVAGGRHDVETWGLVMPSFLRWGWGR